MFAAIAERKIREAIERGDLDDLAGRGKPLSPAEDYFAVPEELRMAYKVLKNAGCVPEEVELRKEIVNLRNLLDTLEDNEEKRKKLKELSFKLIKLEMTRKRPLDVDLLPEYRERVLEKVGG